MKQRLYGWALAGCCAAMLLGACTANYQDDNTNPYEATADDMAKDDYMLRSTLVAMQGCVIPTDANHYQYVECLMGGSYSGYLADSGAWTGKFSTFDPQQFWVQYTFNNTIPNVFINLGNLQSRTDNEVLLAVADILKVAAMHRIADIYGPIPYSQIGADGKTEAPYDSLRDVYLRFFEELDHAVEVLTAHKDETFSAYADKVYSGRVVEWIKLANSLRLRLAMRLSSVEPETAKTQAVAAITHSVGTMSSNDDNAWMTVTKHPLRVVAYEYNKGDSRVGADITAFMNGYNDPRREQYFTLSTFTDEENDYIGVRTGLPTYSEAKNFSNVNIEEGSFLYTHLLWMNAAEVAFLKAEAALRGWYGTPSDVRTWYETGVRLSFEQWGATGVDAYLKGTSAPQAYIDPKTPANNGTPGTSICVQWDDGATLQENLERIITQKWIACFPLGQEGWAEFRRTGYPRLMGAVYSYGSEITDKQAGARRMRYPESEYQENRQYLMQAISEYLNGPDNLATRLWWDTTNKQ